jgi:hypothetical protein
LFSRIADSPCGCLPRASSVAASSVARATPSEVAAKPMLNTMLVVSL